jgi:hypothetical protein
MPPDFPYVTAAAVAASGILTPVIVAVLKKRFPAMPPQENELKVASS